jgi:periplasmic protein CpxP/Spy
MSSYHRNIENGNNQEVIMKLKTLSLIAGTLALTLTATPFSVQAQQNPSSPQQGTEWQKKGQFQRLNLTPEQKTKMQEIGRNTRAQIEAVLTPEQKTKLKAAMAERKAQRQQRQGQQGEGQRQERRGKKGDIFASLNLTDAQKDQIKQIRESSKQQMQAILTPEQLAQMKKFQEEMRSRRQQRQPQ